MIKSEVKDYLGITLALILYSFGFTFFLMPYEIVTGGVAGIAAIVYYATGFPNSYTYFLINAALLGMALKILGVKFLMKTIFATLMLSFLLWFMKDIAPVDENGQMIKILGTILIFVDFLIIGSCLFIPQFGTFLQRMTMVTFGFCTMIIENFMLDYIMNRQRQSVQFMIFSKHHEDIARAISEQTDHTMTILDGSGWYSGKEMKVIVLLAKKSESVMIFRIIKMIDPKAFVSQSAVIGVYGEGFDKIKIKVNG